MLLAVAGLAGGWLLGGPQLAFWLIVYMAITTAYSFRLKAVMVGDTIVLASLYTIRIWIGAIAIGVPLSFWLLLFSVFLFMSLALVKRYAELDASRRDVRWPRSFEHAPDGDKWTGCGLKSCGAGLSTAAGGRRLRRTHDRRGGQPVLPAQAANAWGGNEWK